MRRSHPVCGWLDIVAEPMVIHRTQGDTAGRTTDALESVRLTPAADFVDRYRTSCRVGSDSASRSRGHS